MIGTVKLGLLTDIHEHVEYLETALRVFRHEAVDHIVVIGDIFQTGEHISETCQMLTEAGTVG